MIISLWIFTENHLRPYVEVGGGRGLACVLCLRCIQEEMKISVSFLFFSKGWGLCGQFREFHFVDDLAISWQVYPRKSQKLDLVFSYLQFYEDLRLWVVVGGYHLEKSKSWAWKNCGWHFSVFLISSIFASVFLIRLNLSWILKHHRGWALNYLRHLQNFHRILFLQGSVMAADISNVGMMLFWQSNHPAFADIIPPEENWILGILPCTVTHLKEGRKEGRKNVDRGGQSDILQVQCKIKGGGKEDKG